MSIDDFFNVSKQQVGDKNANVNKWSFGNKKLNVNLSFHSPKIL